MGNTEAKPGDMKKAGQRIVEDSHLVGFLMRLFADARKSESTGISLRQGSSASIAWSLSGGSIDRAGEEPGNWTEFTKLLIARANYWPEAKDHAFESCAERKARLLFRLSAGEVVVADLTVHKSKEDGSTQVCFENIEWSQNDSVSRYFSFSPYHRSLVEQLRAQKHGIVLANREPGRLDIDGCAFVVATRPDVVCYFNIQTAEDAVSALKLSQTRLVLVGFAAEDAADLVFDFASLLSEPALLREYYSRLHSSLVHRRMKKVCEDCAGRVSVPQATLKKLPKILIPTGDFFTREYVGCEKCRDTGIRGQVGIESGLLFDSRLREALLGGASPAQLTELAYRQGARSLLEDALDKHEKGICAFSEVLRCVTKISPAFLSSIASRVGGDSSIPYDQELQSKLDSLAGDLFGTGDENSPPDVMQSSSSPIASANAKSAEESRTQVMVVEDDRDQREILQLVFASAGFDVVTAVDGQDALAVLEKEMPEVVVCDLMMPVMSGEELVRELRATERYRYLPVLMFTAMDDDQRELDLLSAGADDYCRKTIKREILVQRVKRLVSRNTNPLSHFV